MVRAGEPAPDFELPGTEGAEGAVGRRRYTLSEYRGHPVVLAFYPGDDTPVCTRQLNAYTDDVERFRDIGAQVLAISPQSVESHERFAARQGGFGFPLLADEDKAVGRAYGILGPLGFYRRSAFVVDHDGVVRFAHRGIAGLTFRPVDELVEALARLTR